LEHIGAYGRITLKRIFKKEDGKLQNGLICLRIEKSGGW
jgi:hypothetical protein